MPFSNHIIALKSAMSTRLALFDLDNTLLAGDSDHAWGEFLISRNLVDAESHRATNDSYYSQYLAGELDIHGYVRFTVDPVTQLDQAARTALHNEFMASTVDAMILPKGRALIQQHKEAGDTCIIITATNDFVTAPIARELGIDILLATTLDIEDGRITGKIEGVPCYQDGKISKLEDWLVEHTTAEQGLSMQNAVFYSDSINDLPLLQRVDEPVAVDPDPKLEQVACERNWQVISLR